MRSSPARLPACPVQWTVQILLMLEDTIPSATLSQDEGKNTDHGPQTWGPPQGSVVSSLWLLEYLIQAAPSCLSRDYALGIGEHARTERNEPTPSSGGSPADMVSE